MGQEQMETQANDKRPRVSSDWVVSQDSEENVSPSTDYPRKRVNVACEVCRAINGHQSAPKSVSEDNQEVIHRLRRIEGLLENLSQANSNHGPVPPSTGHSSEVLTTPISPGVATAPSLEQRHNHLITETDLISEHALKGLARIVGQTIPEPLLPLSVTNDEIYLEIEIRRGEALLSGPLASLQDLDLSPKTCWRLQQSFARGILPWCPFIDQEECARNVTRTCDLQFPQHDLETSLALFVLALGDISKQDYRGDTANEFKGLDYFQLASSILSQPQHSAYSILAVQCRILKAFYYLFCLRPLQAFNSLHEASLAVLSLLQCKSRLERDPQLKEQVLRAYWTCYLFEHELQSNISYSSCLLQLQNEFVPLPLFDQDEPGSYWFLSEIAFRKIFSNSRDGFGWNAFMLHKTAVVHEIILQLQQWHDYLPGQVKFPMNVSPLMDSHKVFLRAQYFAVVGTLHWSFVVRLLTALPQDEKEYAAHLEAGAKCLESAVMHVHAVEPLLQERHLMLAANIIGLHCCVSILLCAYNVPVLASIQHPEQAEAIHKARNMLANWATSPVVANHVSRLDSLMMSKGLIVLSPAVSFSPAPSYRMG
ncbi:hypothetical protein H2200_004680 [Cladophialophora chaetospira]|uniref:Transcription factor domain-containing protein n=1 Tax=Cladophialophora chaetospira TaxID=386627 RepID=A0AA38XDJ7_9EURO|nr:hypothetical protein H2200_004680 [Cladophialophora chaetospira]